MDNNEYRTMIIVKAYEFSECVPTAAKQCEDWSLTTSNGSLELWHDFFGNDRVYQVILCDQLGRELWLCPHVHDHSALKYQKSVSQILEFCGFDVMLEEDKQKYPKIIMDWLNIKPKQVPVEVIELNSVL
ncbi:hypothetical protein [Lysinibacillus sp. K60]|uniref:hypothetical protein n=1 Tax=Lysinibacillus sp. K60 TaxID=2720027 RepID=UPI001C8C8267|nr:hypothetical protein [Lysinibacillus sp. K60]MBX8945966.1 hypothetical protein [Lysinibacillus sp. K60]